MKHKILLCFIVLLCLVSCKDEPITICKDVYETEIIVHYSTYERTLYIVYSNDKLETCSFNGTNYLIEKNNSEELFSTTAPIEIIKQFKYDHNGNKRELENPNFKRKN